MNTHEFLDHFDGNICYSAIHDKKESDTFYHWHEGFSESRDQILRELGTKNRTKSGHGIFFCVNEINRNLHPGRTRTHHMLVRCRAVFIDDDTPRDSHREGFRLEPSIIVESSPGKFHYYWLTSTTDFDEWDRVMNTLVAEEEGDPGARDRVRVMRLPGFKHLKKTAFTSRVVGGNSRQYDWDEITSKWAPSDEAPVRTVDKDGKTRTVRMTMDMPAAINLIQTGANFHESIRYLGLHYSNMGMKPESIKMTIEGLMAGCEIKDDRWQQRMNQMDTNLKDWVRFVEENPLEEGEDLDEEIEVEVVNIEEQQAELNWPPGEMGTLCKEIHEMAHYQNRELSIMAGFALVAGMTGRKYNVSGAGLNMYMSCLGVSGIGKSIVKDSINKALVEVGQLVGGQLFAGPARFTGPKAVLKMLELHPVRVCVMEEAGLVGASRAGDQIGINRVLLDLYTSSGQGKWSGEEMYSDTKDSTARIKSPALTVASVSTPESFTKALMDRDATNSGDLARTWTLRTLREKPYINLERRGKYSDEIRLRIRTLLKICAKGEKSEEKFDEVYDVDMGAIDFISLDRHWVDLERTLHNTDPQKAAIASRAVMKVLKIASIISVFNEPSSEVKIDKEAFEWAKKAVEEEFKSITLSVKLNDSTDMEAVISHHGVPFVSKILNRIYAEGDGRNAPEYLAKRGIFSMSNFKAAVKNIKAVKDLASDTQRSNKAVSGADKLLGAMVGDGLLIKLKPDECRRLTKRGRAGQLYKVTEDFKIAVNGMDIQN